MQEKSVYIHIPFCKKICSYCDFCKFIYNSKWVDDYLIALKKEIEDHYQWETIKTLYIGGGTPSSLDEKQLNNLFQMLKIFKLASNYEFTFECNLNDINDKLINVLVKNGVNRLSIGIESFDLDNLQFMNRTASFEEAQKKIKLCKEIGLNNINIDLIYALPNESIEVLKKDLDYFIKLDISHISTYSLMIENHTMLSYQNIKPIDEDLDAKMYELICNTLKKKGFIHYEISNFAREGFESKHNLVYWNNEEYYGFGLGASGYLNNVRYTNTQNLNDYLKGKTILEEEHLSQKETMDYEIMLGLRKIKGINLEKFYEKYHVQLQEEYPIDNLIKEKKLIIKNGNIFINPDKLYIMNEILVKLL